MVDPQTIDLSRANDYRTTVQDLVLRRLKRDGHYKDGLVYRGFNGERLGIVLAHGTDTPDSDTMFCCEEIDLVEGEQSEDSALFYALVNNPVPALAVYDGSKLTFDCIHEARFADPKNKLDALIAVYLFQE